MLTQKIIGTEFKTVKYHGTVKFLIFECNNCSKQFSKMESYSRKQLKIHKNACCFCSPDCRNDYFNRILLAKTKGFTKAAQTVNIPEEPNKTAEKPHEAVEKAKEPVSQADAVPKVAVSPSLETPAVPQASPPSPKPEKKKESTSFFGWLNKVLEG